MIRDFVRRQFAQAIVALVLVLAVQGPASAQRDAPPQRRGWLPPRMQWADAMTSAQRTTAMTVLREIERIVLRIPELANPDGFEIEPAFSGGYHLLGPDDTPLPNAVLRYSYGLAFYSPTKAIAGEGAACLSMVVNDNPPPAAHVGKGDLQVYIEGDRGKPVPHATAVLGELLDVPRERSGIGVIFVSAGELPWRQVTREELFNTLLHEQEPGATELRAALQKTPYQEWMEQADERRKNREDILREAARSSPPAEVEKLRQTLEGVERETTELLRRNEATDRERFADARASLSGISDSLRATLGRMTPAERTMPAYVNNALREGPRAMGYVLTSDTSPPAWRLLTPNWSFWRARRSPVEVRSIGVTIAIGLSCLKPEIQRTLLETFRSLDWAAINRLLDEPR